mgnify:CR=1 FL=1
MSRPFRAARKHRGCPRALPWAGMSGPFGARRQPLGPHSSGQQRAWRRQDPCPGVSVKIGTSKRRASPAPRAWRRAHPAALLGPKGAAHTSPGQRPGCLLVVCPALKGRDIPTRAAICASALETARCHAPSGLRGNTAAAPGRCPGLVCQAPSGLGANRSVPTPADSNGPGDARTLAPACPSRLERRNDGPVRPPRVASSASGGASWPQGGGTTARPPLQRTATGLATPGPLPWRGRHDRNCCIALALLTGGGNPISMAP